MLLDQRANLAVREAFGGRINGEHQPGIASAVVVRLGQHDELTRHQLLAMVVPHRPRHEQQLAFLDLALEKWAAWPGAFEQTALVLEHRAKYSQAAPRRQHTGAHDAADTGHILTDGGASQRRHGRGVEIAMRRVIQQVAHRADAEPLQRLGAFWADAFKELYR